MKRIIIFLIGLILVVSFSLLLQFLGSGSLTYGPRLQGAVFLGTLIGIVVGGILAFNLDL